ncbi:MAG: DUF4886 domain-containing protein [Pirellulaceae bacterium]|nr:DUF4886 domain-containing protein [Pirellulaceae bacterium]
MIRRLLCPWFVCLVLLLDIQVAGPIVHGAEPAARTVRLLTVGNSFSRNATRHLEGLVEAGGHELIHRPIIVGGASLELHADKAQRHEQDANDPAGLYANGRSLKQELQSEPWDFVTIQQASIRSHDVDTYRPYARQLFDIIRKYAPQAEVVMHQTWAYRCDDPRFAVESPKPGEPATQEAMYQGLSNAYRTTAAELGVRMIPVGDAFYRADTDPRWGYRPDSQFDFQNARPPALPDQTHSLHIGWRWSKRPDGTSVLGMDGHHANLAGEYLGGCVFYEFLFETSVVGNPFVPAGLDPDYARFLQQTAHDTVASMAKSSPPATTQRQTDD